MKLYIVDIPAILEVVGIRPAGPGPDYGVAFDLPQGHLLGPTLTVTKPKFSIEELRRIIANITDSIDEVALCLHGAGVIEISLAGFRESFDCERGKRYEEDK